MKFICWNKQIAQNAISELQAMAFGTDGKTEKPKVVTIVKFQKKRTNPQNRYYWGVIVKISCDFFGYTSEEMHYHFGELFRKLEEREVFGIARSVHETTTKMSAKDFAEYNEKCRIWLRVEFGVDTPDPDPYYKGII